MAEAGQGLRGHVYRLHLWPTLRQTHLQLPLRGQGVSDPRNEGVYLKWENDGHVLLIERVCGDGSVTTMFLARDPEVAKLKKFLELAR